MAKARTQNGSVTQSNPGALSLPLISGEIDWSNDDARTTGALHPEEQQNTQVDAPPRTIPGKKLYQDEIYGTKELSPLAVALIDTPEFQRLSQIYQLGFTYTVFRGATHRRFDHCVGAYFIVRTLLRRVVQNHARFFRSDPDQFCHPGLWLSPRLYMEAPATPKQWQRLYSPMGRWRGLVEVVSAAALLHDLGHVPVGHTMEDEFTLFRKHDSLGGLRLFEMLYGPREPRSMTREVEAVPRVENYFTRIDMSKLPRPESWERVPLPWVLEDRTYRRFLPDVTEGDTAAVPALQNHEIRDLIYLILSFKETVDGEIGHVKYKTFEQELDEAQESAKKEKDEHASRRVAFIKALYEYYSRPAYVGPDQDELPLFHPFMSDAVGNTICADLLDYLVRDGKRLKLDVRDNPRLQRYLVIRPASSSTESTENTSVGPPRRLAINAVSRDGLKRRDTVSDLMDLMSERYRFAEIVYYHPKKAAFSAMIAKAIEILSQSSERITQLDKGSIYPAPWAPTGTLPTEPRHVCHFGDESLLAFLAKEAEEAGSAPAAALIRGIVSRSEYRLIFTLDYEAASGAGGAHKFRTHLREDNDSGRKEMEETLKALVTRSKIKEEVPILLYCPSIRMQAKEVAAHVELTPNKVVPLSLEGEDQQVAEEIRVLNTKYQRLWRLYIFAHPKLVPTDEDATDKKFLLSTIVDTFCDRFGVPERVRPRGSRYRFIPFEVRVRERFRDWQKSAPVDLKIGEELETRIRKIALDRRFWRAFLPLNAPLPATDEEYKNGFNRALLICEADSVSAGQRDKWPECLRPIRGHAWYVASSVPNVERARKSGFDLLGSLAASVGAGPTASADAKKWEPLADLVTARLGSSKDAEATKHPEQSAAARALEVLTIIEVFVRLAGQEEGVERFWRVYPSRLDSLSPEQYRAVASNFRNSVEQQRVIDAEALDHRGAKLGQALEWLDEVIEDVKANDARAGVGAFRDDDA